MSLTVPFANPYRPGAGHMPPHLAGRLREFEDFRRLLAQDIILENMVLTGLRGVGKTVLLDAFKPLAIAEGWIWVGTDLSESASVSEEAMATRLLADLAVATSGVTIQMPAKPGVGFSTGSTRTEAQLSYDTLRTLYSNEPGLVADKLRAVLRFAWECLNAAGKGRVVFAYDEAQNLSDRKDNHEYPLSVLLDVFQSLQRQGIPFMLVLTGLPTLFPKLVEARTFAERMFHVVMLGRLDGAESRDAILKPIEVADCPVRFGDPSVEVISEESAGYPYFIQFICREVFDIFIQRVADGAAPAAVPVEAIQMKLDADFFAGRWARVTDRQRDLLWVVARLDKDEQEFSIQELVRQCENELANPFSSSHLGQMLSKLGEQGLIYKNRFGRYSFAVPLLGRFILRTYDPARP